MLPVRNEPDHTQPFDGSARTVDQLIDRLKVVDHERAAILEELRRQRERATCALELYGG